MPALLEKGSDPFNEVDKALKTIFMQTCLCVPLAAALVLGGCANMAPRRDPAYALTHPVSPQVSAPRNGSIYEASGHMVLFTDIKAQQVGDTLTIRLVEKTDASKKADTDLNQETDFNIENPTLMGYNPSWTWNGTDYTLENKFNSTKDFEGEAESEQSNKLTGDITVTVAEVMANGNLRVQGEKLMTLNRGHEHIRLSGIVRPYDIDDDNVVVSTKVANATIVYAGQGELADANSLGLMGRFFLGWWPY